MSDEWRTWPNSRWVQGLRGDDPEVRDLLARHLYLWSSQLLRRYPDYDREELAQRSVIRAWTRTTTKLDQYRGGVFLAWARTITVRETYGVIREELAQKGMTLSLDIMVEAGNEPVLDPPQSQQPVVPVLTTQRSSALQACWSTLDGRQQRVIEGLLAEEEPAALMGELQLTRANLNQIRHRSLLKLRSCMGQKGFGYA